jgi:hypothetical protein
VQQKNRVATIYYCATDQHNLSTSNSYGVYLILGLFSSELKSGKPFTDPGNGPNTIGKNIPFDIKREKEHKKHKQNI